MIKKVVFVVGLFLVVDRVMYYKLGQTTQQEQYALSSPSMTSLHKLAKQERSVRKRVVLYAKQWVSGQIKSGNELLV